MSTPQAIARVESAIAAAERLESRLTPEILAMDGMSSPKVRHFLNNVVHDGDRYLEIGCYRGSTLISAMAGKSTASAFAIDNFSAFDAPREDFHKNLAAFKIEWLVRFLDGDCFSRSVIDQVPEAADVYFYDGPHETLDQWRAVQMYLPKLANPCIYICDDYYQPQAQIAWRELLKSGMFTVAKQWILHAEGSTDVSTEAGRGWWNGVLVAVIEH